MVSDTRKQTDTGETHVTETQLGRLQGDYQAAQDQVRELGFIAVGSVLERYTVCGSQGCRCHADPPAKHGPYFQYTRKLDGKTLTRRLDPAQAERYRGWIANRRRLDELIKQMDQISRQAADLLTSPQPRALATPPD
jgi:hypothetical protein